MADPNYSWVYLIIFLAIPLARIIPRILSKYGIGKNTTNTIQEKQFQSGFDEYSQKPQMESSESSMNTSKPQTKNNLVLGVLNRGSKTFENIQKNTGLDNTELDAILEDLEKNGLMKVVHKQGMFGPKTEIIPTDKGFREYYS
jgi:DNA-binding HxlR family transcriptional regulator